MSVAITLTIDDAGQMTVSVDPQAQPEQGNPNVKQMPVKSLDEALRAIQQVATEATAQESPAQEQAEGPQPPQEEEQAMDAAYQGKKMPVPQAGM
jgi:ribosomal protein L12E/L44/L45/RPP1/RPP2